MRTGLEIGKYKDTKEYCNKDMIFPIKGEVIRNKEVIHSQNSRTKRYITGM